VGCATIGGDTAVGISGDGASFLVDANIVEVEQVSVRPTNKTEKTDGTFLDWITFGCINRDPMSATIVGGSNIKVPDTLIGGLVLKVAPCGAAEETESSSITITSYDGRKNRALNPTFG